MATKKYTIRLDVHVRSKDSGRLPEQHEVENLACSLLLTPPGTDTDVGWDVYSTHVRENDER